MIFCGGEPMSTITLYKDKVNGVGSLIDDIIKSSNNLNTQLGTLRNTIQGVSSSTCDLQSTVDSISSSSKSEKEKVEDLKKLNGKLTEFIELTDKRDESARDAINKSKKDFYSKYKHLKPESEKSFLEHIVDDVQALGEWCKEHWKFVATLVMVVAAIAVLLIPGVGPIISAACWGVILGAAKDGILGGIASKVTGGSFFEGFEEGAFSGAIKGGIKGLFFGVTGTTLDNVFADAGMDAGISVIGDIGDMLIKGEDKSVGEIFLNAGVSFSTSLVGGGLNKLAGKFIKIPKINSGKGNWDAVFRKGITCSFKHSWKISPKTVLKGMTAQFVSDGFGVGDFVNNLLNEKYADYQEEQQNQKEDDIKYNRFSIDVSIDIPDINVNPIPAM